MPKNLSIIITHHRTPELLDLCIKSVKENSRNINHEVIVVDSEQEEKTESFIKNKHPEIKFISFKKNLGYSKLVNAGIKQATRDYILIINADIIALDGSILKMLEYLEEHQKVGMVGPQLLDFSNKIQISCFANPTFAALLSRRTFFKKTKWGKRALDEFTMSNWDRNSEKEVDWIQGSAIMVRKKMIDRVGPWDERFFMYFEDADWCRRFWQNGYKVVYLPSAKMAHYYHRSSKKFGAIFDIIFNRYTRTHIISAIKYFSKHRNK